MHSPLDVTMAPEYAPVMTIMRVIDNCPKNGSKKEASRPAMMEILLSNDEGRKP
jgi:hypothetical protein